ncbi:GTPase HflX [Pontiella sulfatireligans]|uniref:GTPase HflX n=1 Tax=Pontiella sulfatireligans TaxID=2750658 RepID=A0A6C2ULC3_9BACT|nr:GTPase HflX [Pontiella sulfatireligans]VGO20104.1 GTPase HflX [Pontiella sulfatireligans]
MSELLETQNTDVETVLLVGVVLRGDEEWKVKDTMDELAQLAESAGAEVVGRFVCRQPKIKAGHYIGTGKAEEIADWIKENPVSMVVFDDDLTPAQGRNLEKVLETRVLDRTQLILDIFAQRAHTREGSLQVELAQHLYLLPRLRNMWTHLERQQGGIGLRGPGETQLEMDRRRIEDLIKTIKRDLKLVRTRRTEQRRGRRRHGWALVSIVGYTNAGKSTLLNRLSGADIYAEDQLFATLDPTTRQVELPNHEPMLMTDTVGFIQKLPHHLVDSFKATLEEVAEADLIVHVIDALHPQVEMQIEAVHKVLDEIGGLDKPMLYVFNKIDEERGRNAAKRLKAQFSKSAAVSALTGEGIDLLFDELADCLKGRKVELKLSVPLSEGKLLATLQKNASILEQEYEGANAELLVRVSAQIAAQCRPFAVE